MEKILKVKLTNSNGVVFEYLATKVGYDGTNLTIFYKDTLLNCNHLASAQNLSIEHLGE